MKFGKLLIVASLMLCVFTSLVTQYAFAADVPVVQVSQIPFKHDHISTESDLPRVALGLTVCLLLLAGVLYVIRQRLGLTLETGRVKQLRVLESHRLNPRSSLYVVEFAGKVHMLAQSEQGINCLVSTPIIDSLSPEKHG